MFQKRPTSCWWNHRRNQTTYFEGGKYNRLIQVQVFDIFDGKERLELQGHEHNRAFSVCWWPEHGSWSSCFVIIFINLKLIKCLFVVDCTDNRWSTILHCEEHRSAGEAAGGGWWAGSGPKRADHRRHDQQSQLPESLCQRRIPVSGVFVCQIFAYQYTNMNIF